MAIGLKESVQVSSYIPKETKQRMERIAAANRRKTISCQIEEALLKYLPEMEASFLPPTQEARSGKKNTAA